MALPQEATIPRSGPWRDLSGGPGTIALVGGQDLADRLAPTLGVVRLDHRDPAPLDRVQGVLVQGSAFLPGTGGWAYALSPIGFDRTHGLRTILASAEEFEVPVVLLDDTADDDVLPWLVELAAVVDSVRLMRPPSGDGQAHWLPPSRLDREAIALSRVAPAQDAGRIDLSALLPEGFRRAQRRAAAVGRVHVDRPGDPWSSLLAAELAALGVVVDGGRDDLAEWAGAADADGLGALHDWLGIETPATPQPTVLVDPETSDIELAEIDAVLEHVGGRRASTASLHDVVRGLEGDGVVVLPPVEGPFEPDALRACIQLASRCPEAPAIRGPSDRGPLLLRSWLVRLLVGDLAHAREAGASVATIAGTIR